MSGSDLLPLVAVVLRDKAAVEAAEEIESLRKQLMEARLCHRKIEIVASEGTVLATASLEGIEPKKDNRFILCGRYAREMASVQVPVTMVDGIHANKTHLDHLKVRIGGIDAYKLGIHRPLPVNRQDDNDQDQKYFSLAFPTFFRHQNVVTDDNVYQVDIDGHKLILNEIIFTCGSGDSADGMDENVVFKTIQFSALVEEEVDSSSFLLSLRRLFEQAQAAAP